MIKIKMDERPPTVHDQWLIQVLRCSLKCCTSYIVPSLEIWCIHVQNNECDQNFCQVIYCHCVLLSRDSVAMLLLPQRKPIKEVIL